MHGFHKDTDTDTEEAEVMPSDMTEEEVDAGLEIIDEHNFNEKVMHSHDIWMLKFSAPWCHHCNQMKPNWISAAKELGSKVRFGIIDADANRGLARRFGINMLPSLKFYEAGMEKSDYNLQDYTGGRSAEELVDFAQSLYLGRRHQFGSSGYANNDDTCDVDMDEMMGGDMTSGDMMTSGGMASGDMMGSGDMTSGMMSGMMSGAMTSEEMSGHHAHSHDHLYNHDIQSEIQKFIENSDYYKKPDNEDIYGHYGYKEDDATEAEIEDMVSGMMTSGGMASGGMASGEMMSDEAHGHGYGFKPDFDPYADFKLPHGFGHGDDAFAKEEEEVVDEDTAESMDEEAFEAEADAEEAAAEDDDFEVDIDAEDEAADEAAEEDDGSSAIPDMDMDDMQGGDMDSHMGYADHFHKPIKPNGPGDLAIDDSYDISEATRMDIYNDNFKDTVKSIGDDIKEDQIYEPMYSGEISYKPDESELYKPDKSSIYKPEKPDNLYVAPEAPYTPDAPKKEDFITQKYYDHHAHGDDSGDDMTSDSMTSGGMTSGGMTSGGMASGEMSSGGMTSGGMTSGDTTSADMEEESHSGHSGYDHKIDFGDLLSPAI